MLPKCFVIFVPLFCLLLPYEGTLLLLTPFEMLVRFPVLLVLPYTRRVYAGQKCVVLLTSFVYLVQCLKRVSFFCLSFYFFSCTFFPFQHTRGVDDAQIRQYFCWIASFFGSCAQFRDTAGPNIFQIAKNKNCCHLPHVLPIAFSKVDAAQIQHCTAFTLVKKGQVLHKLEF